MIWPVVARRYMESFERARASLSVPSIETVGGAQDRERELPDARR